MCHKFPTVSSGSFLGLFWMMSLALPAGEADSRSAEDVSYGEKSGMRLVMDVYQPQRDRNDVGLIFVASGGWTAKKQPPDSWAIQTFVKRGYTVFSVLHSSQPKFTIPEMLDDLHRSVRFIRRHAADYDINPSRIGIYGISSGGHLSLMQAVGGKAGDQDAEDPIDREDSRVQAAACFCPPTDFLNFGQTDAVSWETGPLKNFQAPFDFHEYRAENNSFVKITDPAQMRELGRSISPKYHVTKKTPPVMLIHGTADELVPFQQSQLMAEALKASGAPHELIVKEGAAHAISTMVDDIRLFVDWFDKHLVNASPNASTKAVYESLEPGSRSKSH